MEGKVHLVFCLLILGLFLDASWCHPQCLDFKPPFDQKEPLEFCSQYSGVSCCSPEQDRAIRARYERISAANPFSRAGSCAGTIKDLLCQQCSPYAAHIYDAEATGRAREVPGMCTSYCEDFYNRCKRMIYYVYNTSASLGDRTLGQALETRRDFCTAVRLPDMDYCYPALLENPVLNGDISREAITQEGCLCVEEFARDLANPLVFRAAPDGTGRIFIGQQRGVVEIFYRNGTKLPEPFLDLTSDVLISAWAGDERGFLNLAFHPQFRENRKFYIFFSRITEGRHHTRISEYRESLAYRNTADMTSERVILEVYQPYGNHNGGELLFGDDGYLYVFLGDGGAGGDPLGSGQDKSSLLGKVLRIDVDTDDPSIPYIIPPDNPFTQDQDTRNEIWAYGIRNIWRCDMDEGDPDTGYGKGRIFCGDVGQSSFEEIDIIHKGGNYGWNAREGFQCYKQNLCGNIGEEILPIFAYPHSQGKSVTGGHVYRGCMNPNLQGQYIYGDFVRGRIWALRQNMETGSWTNRELFMCGSDVCFNGLEGNFPNNIMSFGEDQDGEIYILSTSYASSSQYGGKVMKLVDPRRRGDPKTCRTYRDENGQRTSTSSTTTTTTTRTTTTQPTTTTTTTTTTRPTSTTRATTTTTTTPTTTKPTTTSTRSTTTPRSQSTTPTSAAEEDVSRLVYTITSCEGNIANFVCPKGHHITINSAVWGRSDPGVCPRGDDTDDVTCSVSDISDLLRAQCAGKQECDVTTTSNYLGECFERTSEYLYANYSCSQSVVTSLMCESSGKLLVFCPDNQRIQAEKAFFGRGDFNVTCPHATAMNQSDCSAETATEVFKQRCDGKEECELEATVDIFGDPCPGSYKYLELEYTCAECVNEYGSDMDCEYWYLRGECAKNPDWMYVNCRKSCWGCDEDEPPCVNNIADEDCESLAANGDCDNFPAWMLSRCRKTCMNCDEEHYTVCENQYQPADATEDGCEEFTETGECSLNPDWMLGRCTKSCFFCDGRVKCENQLDDESCDAWRAQGECENNPGFMIPLCLKSCLNCSSDPVCQNLEPDYLCDNFTMEGECARNPLWMYTNCWKSCMNCQGPPACTNGYEMNGLCEDWAQQGECHANPLYMMPECRESCTRCKPEQDSVTDCRNRHLAQQECLDWSVDGECSANPVWMYSQCQESCTGCNRPQNFTYIGNKPQPGSTSVATISNSMVLPDVFPVRARVTHFMAYFNTTKPVYLQLWKPIRGSDVSMAILYQLRYVPKRANSVETVFLPDCVMVNPGDRFGFMTVDAVAPISYRFDVTSRHTLFRDAGSSGDFDQLPLPYAFQISAVFDESQECSSIQANSRD